MSMSARARPAAPPVAVKLAETVRLEITVSVTGFVEPEAAPDQLVKENPLLAVAVSWTVEPEEYWPVGQLPLLAGLEVIEPLSKGLTAEVTL